MSRGGKKKGKQEYRVSGSWNRQPESTCSKVKCCNNADCTHRMIKQGFIALKRGDWEEYKNTFRKEVKVSEWAFDRIEKAFEKVAKDEAKQLSIVQEIMIRSTGYLRRIIARAGRQGGVTMSYLRPHCNSFPLEDYVWWVSGGKGRNNWWCAICVNSTPHTSHFLVDSHLMTRTCVAQALVWCAQCTFHIISCVIFMRSCCVCLILRDSPFLFLLSIFSPIVLFIYQVFSFFFQDVVDKFPVHSR